ncbi:hypothetical protein K2173_024105 [Erythroxylum novogranatense]|uniref:Uncharacterized protein n=1 Tax=Erythroxylum novogranatense TaxID=1862640 RepID=A0AAV8UD83_9ROSI|nr:hypothetical protein K2173_024105 [Erythroxylum novogranatense]
MDGVLVPKYYSKLTIHWDSYRTVFKLLQCLKHVINLDCSLCLLSAFFSLYRHWSAECLDASFFQVVRFCCQTYSQALSSR